MWNEQSENAPSNGDSRYYPPWREVSNSDGTYGSSTRINDSMSDRMGLGWNLSSYADDVAMLNRRFCFDMTSPDHIRVFPRKSRSCSGLDKTVPLLPACSDYDCDDYNTQNEWENLEKCFESCSTESNLSKSSSSSKDSFCYFPKVTAEEDKINFYDVPTMDGPEDLRSRSGKSEYSVSCEMLGSHESESLMKRSCQGDVDVLCETKYSSALLNTPEMPFEAHNATLYETLEGGVIGENSGRWGDPPEDVSSLSGSVSSVYLPCDPSDVIPCKCLSEVSDDTDYSCLGGSGKVLPCCEDYEYGIPAPVLVKRQRGVKDQSVTCDELGDTQPLDLFLSIKTQPNLVSNIPADLAEFPDNLCDSTQPIFGSRGLLEMARQDVVVEERNAEVFANTENTSLPSRPVQLRDCELDEKTSEKTLHLHDASIYSPNVTLRRKFKRGMCNAAEDSSRLPSGTMLRTSSSMQRKNESSLLTSSNMSDCDAVRASNAFTFTGTVPLVDGDGHRKLSCSPVEKMPLNENLSHISSDTDALSSQLAVDFMQLKVNTSGNIWHSGNHKFDFQAPDHSEELQVRLKFDEKDDDYEDVLLLQPKKESIRHCRFSLIHPNLHSDGQGDCNSRASCSDASSSCADPLGDSHSYFVVPPWDLSSSCTARSDGSSFCTGRPDGSSFSCTGRSDGSSFSCTGRSDGSNSSSSCTDRSDGSSSSCTGRSDGSSCASQACNFDSATRPHAEQLQDNSVDSSNTNFVDFMSCDEKLVNLCTGSQHERNVGFGFQKKGGLKCERHGDPVQTLKAKDKAEGLINSPSAKNAATSLLRTSKKLGVDFIDVSWKGDASLSPGGRPLMDSRGSEVLEFLYEDSVEEESHESSRSQALVERRCLPIGVSRASLSTTAASDCQNDDNCLENTILYDWRTISKHTQFDCPLPARKASNPELPSQIPVPLLPSTRDVVLRQARRRRVGTQPQKTHPRARAHHDIVQISMELARALHSGTVPDCRALDDALAREFDTSLRSVFAKARRGGQAKCCFNYLLLDSRVTKQLPNDLSASCSPPGTGFATFVGAIFYVGKGSRSRPYQHFMQALDHLRCPRLKSNAKVKQILAVWKADCGVVSLHCFQSAAPLAALTREACIIDALGLSSLTNAKRGEVHGEAKCWKPAQRRNLGVHLLHRAFLIYLAEGERQLRPWDIN